MRSVSYNIRIYSGSTVGWNDLVSRHFFWIRVAALFLTFMMTWCRIEIIGVGVGEERDVIAPGPSFSRSCFAVISLGAFFRLYLEEKGWFLRYIRGLVGMLVSGCSLVFSVA